MLGSGEITEETLRAIFTDVCQVKAPPDGLEYDPASITIREIREGQVYQGLRVKVRGRLGNARVEVQIDVGAGDAITPEPIEVDFPTLLDLPAPHLKAYPSETVVAEKLDAMVQLGLRNSRMRVGDEVEVIGMPGEDECSHEMFVSIRWDRKEGLAVPLSQLKPAGDTDERTREAVEDWQYWVRMGYEF